MNQLQTLRIKAGLTQAQLAEMSRTHRTTIISLEQGKRPARRNTLAKLANALGLDWFAVRERYNVHKIPKTDLFAVSLTRNEKG